MSTSLHVYILDMLAFGAVYLQLKGNPKLGFFVGKSQFMGGWDILVRKFLGEHIHLRDWSSFDISQSVKQIWAAVYVLKQFVPEDFHYLCDRAGLNLQISLVRHINGDLHMYVGGNVSGGAGTIFINMIIGLIFMSYGYFKAGKQDLLPTMKAELCGDDSITSNSALSVEEDDLIVSSSIEDFGWTMKYHTHSDNILDLDFCSKGTRLAGGTYVSTFSVDKCLDSLKYYSSTVASEYLDKINSLITECAWSDGVEKLVSHRDAFIDIIAKDPLECDYFWDLAISNSHNLVYYKMQHLHSPE